MTVLSPSTWFRRPAPVDGESAPPLPTTPEVPASTVTAIGDVSRQELRERGRAARSSIPRGSHAGWSPPLDRRDPLEILAESNLTRVPELVPVRYGRMLDSPFTYFRGAPAVMAHDLASTPMTSIRPQICGDAHLGNFGLFATPERRLVFDLNDFDETLPGPFEWDVKRLAASIVVAADSAGRDRDHARAVVVDAVRAYASRSDELAGLSTLDIWYQHADVDRFIERQEATDPAVRTAATRAAGKARNRTSLRALDRLTTVADGRRVIVEDPPLVVHLPFNGEIDLVYRFFQTYASTLQPERRHLLRQFRVVDAARKVVGVGSVGTRCYIVLAAGRTDLDPLFLQVKQALPSVLELFCGPSEFAHHGERVVLGQRLMQAASDLFLGWSTGIDGNDYFVRQLRDMKGSADVESLDRRVFAEYAVSCARTLARAHARTLDPALVSGYLGRGNAFAEAIAQFGVDYADQTHRDHAQLVEAVRDGRIETIEGR